MGYIDDNETARIAAQGREDYRLWAEGRARCLAAGGCPECFCVAAEQGVAHWKHCSQWQDEEQVEAIHQLAYDTIRRSPHWAQLTNAQWDAEADKLAAAIATAIDGYFKERDH